MEATEKYVKSKSENPYRFGVLVGNHVEDRFGQELIEKLVSRVNEFLAERIHHTED